MTSIHTVSFPKFSVRWLAAAGFAASALGGVACDDGGEAPGTYSAAQCNVTTLVPGTELPQIAELTDPYGEENTGTYLIRNNVWNGEAIKRDQSIVVRAADKRVGFQVTGSVLSTQTVPASYPSIVRGWHWGTWTENSGLPLKMSEIKAVPTTWITSLPKEGAYNVSFDLWIHPDPNPSSPAGGIELMIWTYAQGQGVGPAGTGTGGTVIGGKPWGIYSGPMQNWKYVAYTMGCKAERFQMDLNDVLKDAVSRGLVPADWNLLSIQAGFEIWQGGTGLRTVEFTTEVQ